MVSAFCILHSTFLFAVTPYYYLNRSFSSVQFNLQGIPAEYQLSEETDKLTDIVQGAIQLNSNETYAIEKQAAIPICYLTAQEAWEAAVAYNGTASNYLGKIYDNVGWVRGTKKTTPSTWGAYLWVLQNRIAFQSSTSVWWQTTNGIPVAISNVMVGSLGDYGPVSNVVDIGPSIPSNYLGANQKDWGTYQVDITNVYYELVIPDIWIMPRDTVVAVGGSNVQFTVTGTNIPQGVNWSLIPDLSGSGGAEIQSNGAWQADVAPGNIGTNYTVRATSKDNTNFYDQVSLTIRKVDIMETNIYIAISNNVTLHLTADSSTNTEWEVIPELQNGAYIEGSDSGTSIVINAGLLATNYTVKAYAEDLTNCYDTCTVTVVKVELEKCAAGFLPQGGTNDNTTTIRSFITPATIKGTFKFTLFDVSDEKGYCLNAPTNLPASGEDSDNWKDFQFPSQTGFTISGADSNVAETISNDLHDATVTIKSFDYGSFGKIKAEFTTQDSSLTCIAKEVGGTNEYTRLPADTNCNDIADSWSGDTGPGTSNSPTNDNDNIPALGRVSGDGFSRYQEYRGFIINGTHIRTSPTNKDLFIYDEDNITLGYFGAFGVSTHLIKADEWSGTGNNATDRVIDIQAESYDLVFSQHGLHLRDYNLLGYHNWGLATGANEGPPRESPEIQIDVSQINADQAADNPTSSPDDRAGECVDYVTAHELSHGVYVTHHTPPESGVTNCLMRYIFNEIDTHKKSANDDAPAWAAMTIPSDMCDTDPDNCRSEVKVTDAP